MKKYCQGWEVRRFFEQRLAVDEDRIVSGFVSYDTVSAPIPKFDGSDGSFSEALARGCFKGASGKMLPILLNHVGTDKLGMAKIQETEAGVSFRLQLDDSELADELIRGIGDRSISGVSPSFFVKSERWPSENYRVVEDADLVEISFVDIPAYSGTCASMVAKRKRQAKELMAARYPDRPYAGISFEPEIQVKWWI